jgi:hypothetical protein
MSSDCTVYTVGSVIHLVGLVVPDSHVVRDTHVGSRRGSYCSSRVDETEVSAEDMLNNEPMGRRMGIMYRRFKNELAMMEVQKFHSLKLLGG